VREMALRLVVEECREKVKEFVDSLKMIPQWRFYSESKVSIGNEQRIDYFCDEKPYMKMKPSISSRSVSKLTITSENGGELDIVLLDAQVVEMGNGITYVHGLNYDVFSCKQKQTLKKFERNAF
jgi:hypothetical protein